MRRQRHPLAGALHRAMFDRGRRTEEGDTLIEVLMTLIILSICVLALIITFATAITTSVDHRNLAVNATVLRNIERTSFYQLEQQPSPLFKSCAVNTDYTNPPPPAPAINFHAPTGYTVTMDPIQYWDRALSTFDSTCTPGSPQLIKLTVKKVSDGSTATTQIAVDGIGAASNSLQVLSVLPLTASQGTSNLLLTITGTGFVSGATVSFPSTSGISVSTSLPGAPGTAAFVSPTTLTALVSVASNATPNIAQPVTVTNPDTSTATGGSFTVLPTNVTGMHVSAMVSNIGEPVQNDTDEWQAWDAWVTITVQSASKAPLAGVVVNGLWSYVPNGETVTQSCNTRSNGACTSCVTDSTGTCTVHDGYPDVFGVNDTTTFTVSTSTSSDPLVGGLVLTGQTYTPGSNTPGALPVIAPPKP